MPPTANGAAPVKGSALRTATWGQRFTRRYFVGSGTWFHAVHTNALGNASRSACAVWGRPRAGGQHYPDSTTPPNTTHHGATRRGADSPGQRVGKAGQGTCSPHMCTRGSHAAAGALLPAGEVKPFWVDDAVRRPVRLPQRSWCRALRGCMEQVLVAVAAEPIIV